MQPVPPQTAAALSAFPCTGAFRGKEKTGRLSTAQFGHSSAKKYDLSYHGLPIFATKNMFKICEIITIKHLFLYTSLYISHLFHIEESFTSEYLCIFCIVTRHSIFFPKSRKIQAGFLPHRKRFLFPETSLLKVYISSIFGGLDRPGATSPALACAAEIICPFRPCPHIYTQPRMAAAGDSARYAEGPLVDAEGACRRCLRRCHDPICSSGPLSILPKFSKKHLTHSESGVFVLLFLGERPEGFALCLVQRIPCGRSALAAQPVPGGVETGSAAQFSPGHPPLPPWIRAGRLWGRRRAQIQQTAGALKVSTQ